jgi:hypothetical protein
MHSFNSLMSLDLDWTPRLPHAARNEDLLTAFWLKSDGSQANLAAHRRAVFSPRHVTEKPQAGPQLRGTQVALMKERSIQG